jgi:hypothetical protein
VLENCSLALRTQIFDHFVKSPIFKIGIYFLGKLGYTQINARNYQYSETNVMHPLFNLVRINILYIFRALLAHLQEALHKQHFVYCVRVTSVGCSHASNIPSAAYLAPPEDEQVTLETCKGP